ncbi:conjugative transposon protein TraM [Pinibacter aurantiacus]|uniref:Conjugative transposon protein TraM n=1 Tax=Pinibacter aurantiacus TaxID=2851599 RepID=A0A9E2S7I7_9BACT|nr:conjugative transposon protein TraM [Pinibacter aurantiacus]MBV4357311.1 conjugative transposon protein TraM [Pinibacter aurantiacus]
MIHPSNSKAGYTPKFLRQRKFLVLVPLFVLPLISFLFWSTGLIGSKIENEHSSVKSNGLNTTLPGAPSMKDSSWSKLNFYEAADKEAAKRASLAKSDPYYKLAPMEIVEPTDTNLLPVSTKSKSGNNPYNTSALQYSSVATTSKDPNELKVYQKLDALNKALQEERPSPGQRSIDLQSSQNGISTNDNDITRLESMMQQLQSTGNTTNPEMDQINGMLEKILDIQHPERVKNTLLENSIKNKEQVFPVEANSNELPVTMLQSRNSAGKTEPKSVVTGSSVKFYSLDEVDNNDATNGAGNAIKAMIPEEQVLVSGSTIKLQLVEEVYINGVLVPKGQSIYGEVGLQNERLKIEIHSICRGSSILPVKLSVYDLDGMEGIYMPGAIGRDVAKQSTDQAIQSMGISSLDPSIGAQAASAGIQAAKSLIGKKVKQVRVSVRAGYQVLLLDKTSGN